MRDDATDRNGVKFFRCSFGHDPSPIILEKGFAPSDSNIETGVLVCEKCGRKFPVEHGVPNLLPVELQKYFKSLEDNKPTPTLIEEYKEMAKQIQAMQRMSKAYRHVVVDPHTAAEAAVHFEKYEDILLKQQFEKILKNSKRDNNGIVFLEVGSGPGRLLLQFGAKISNREDACATFRENSGGSSFYSYDPEYEKHLKLLIGIDFSDGMIESALQWIKENKLGHLLSENRMLIVKAAAQKLDINFDKTPYEKSHKLVTCVFQTLGNQAERSLQVELLKRMREWVEPNGTLFVSVFNKALFQTYFEPYYEKIQETIGPIMQDRAELDEGILRTRWGVYSRWFNKENLRDLFRDAGMNKVSIKTGSGFRGGLQTFPEYESYLPRKIQSAVRERAIIATVEV